MSPGWDAVVIGAGVAGLTAALALVRQGARPLVLEAAPHPGGRARSFVDRATGELLDNGPHILVGACTHTLELLEWLGTTHLLHDPGRVELALWSDHRGTGRLLCPPALPAPLHLLAGLLRMPGMSPGDRLAALRLGLGLTLTPHPDRHWEERSVTQWLLAHGQTPHLFTHLWEPLCLAILNEPPASACAALFITVLRKAFLESSRAGRLLLPRLPLEELLTRPAVARIRAGGGDVRCGQRVTALTPDTNRISRIHTRGATLPAPPLVISTLPPWAAGNPLPPPLAPLPPCPTAPIVALHLHYHQEVTLPAPLLGVPGRVSQWLLDRNLLSPTPQPGGRFSAVISGAYRESHWSRERLVAAVTGDLGAVLPQLAGIRPAAVRVIKEWRATPAQWPGQQAHRLSAATPWANLRLAGDWTATGLPATLESAVISGLTAATVGGPLS